jgi:hypothetical protein
MADPNQTYGYFIKKPPYAASIQMNNPGIKYNLPI